MTVGAGRGETAAATLMVLARDPVDRAVRRSYRRACLRKGWWAEFRSPRFDKRAVNIAGQHGAKGAGNGRRWSFAHLMFSKVTAGFFR